MKKKELRRFRKAAGRAVKRARRRGIITKSQREQILVLLLDKEEVEAMAAMCLAQAVKCGLLTAAQAAAGNIKWVGIGENIDWEKLFEFIMLILPMLL